MTKRPARVDELLAWLDRRGSKRNRDGMARYAIVSKKVFGVSVVTLRHKAKQIGRDHALALALWKTGWHEARMLGALVDDPARVTPAQMDRWCRDFDNWAICDTVCGNLFDRTPHVWDRIRAWSMREREFEKRAAFALLVGIAVHDKRAPDAPFMGSLRLTQRAARDERNFVKKAVSWALRTVGRRSPPLRRPAVQLARSLATSTHASERWVGKDALKELTR